MTYKKWMLCLGAGFLLLNGVGVWKALHMWDAHLSGQYPDPELMESPNEKRPLYRRQSLKWAWDLPMVGEHLIGKPLSEPLGEMDPVVAGSFRWQNDRILEFMPTEDWPVAQRVYVNLDTVFTNRHGRVQAVKTSHKLTGPNLAVTHMDSSMQWHNRELQTRLRFNAPVNLKDLRQHLVLMDEKGEKVEPQLQTTPQPEEFLIHAQWNGFKTLTLIVQEGLPSTYGSGGALGKERVYRINPPKQFAYQGRELKQPTFGPGHMEITFSSAPDFQSLQDGITVEPSVDFSVGPGRWWRKNQCRITGDFLPDVRYTFTLTESVRGVNGHPLRQPVRMEVLFPHRKPGLEFAHEGWVLNANGSRQVAVNTQNEEGLTLRLHRVHKNNQVALAVRKATEGNRSHPDRSLSAMVWELEQEVEERGMVHLDLSDVLEEVGKGVYRLRVTGQTSRKTVERLLVVSDIGLLVRRHGEEMMVWGVGLREGNPVQGLEVTLWSDTRQNLGSGITDEQGIARIPLSPDPQLGHPVAVLAQGAGSLGMLTLNRTQNPQGQQGSRGYLQEGYEAYVYASKGIYRPEETVHMRAIVRGKNFQLPGEFPVQLALYNPGGQRVWETMQSLSDVGSVQAEIPLKPEWPNGSYRLTIGLPGDKSPVWGQTRLIVESFVPPQIVVEAGTKTEGEFVDPDFEVELAARMLYGGPAAQHEATATVTLKPEDFRSSEYPDHRFSDERKATFTTWSHSLSPLKTDAEGKAEFKVTLPPEKQGPSALRAIVGISVKEFSGRTATAFVSRRVDRVASYVGIQAKVQDDRKILADVVGVDREGKRIGHSPEVEVEWFRLNWQRGYRRDAKGRYTYMSEEVAVSEGKQRLTLHQGRGESLLTVHAEGQYRIAVRDPETGFSTTTRVWVGRKQGSPERADQLELTFDQEMYAVGDQATVHVSSPFPGKVLMTVEGTSLLRQDVITLQEGSGEWSFMVPDEPAANLWVRAVLVRPQPGAGAEPVLRAHGAAPLRLDTRHLDRNLSLDVEEKLSPSSSVELRLTGHPGAEVVVAGVDEGILLLTQFQTPDPATWFRVLRRISSITWDGFDDLLPELQDALFAGDAAIGGGGVLPTASPTLMDARRLNPIDAKRFTPLTWWSGIHRIPEDGVLTLSMDMPEFSGEVRWMAVQVDPTGMGSADAHSTVSREVVTQQSLPLFLAPGDVTDWTVRLHNQSSEAKTLRLWPGVQGPVKVDAQEVTVELAPGEARLHRWRVKADPSVVGKATCRLNIAMGQEGWQDTIELAVRPVEAFTMMSNSRVLMPGESMPFSRPVEMLQGTLQRSFQVSALPALQLEGSVQYLLRYPYGCLEQTVSAASPALIMPEWVAETKEGASLIVNAGIQSLWKKQRADGSFGYWNRSESGSISGTLLVLDFLLQAREKGYKVDKNSLNAGVEWTKRWLAGRQWSLNSASSNHHVAYAALVLAKAGKLNPGWVQRLRERREDLDRLSRIRCAETMIHLGYRPEALEMLKGLTDSGEKGWDWWSPTSTDADLLRVLLQLDPRDGRIPGLMEEILAKRNRQGRWGHTYENAAVIKAFVAYARLFGRETETPKVEWRFADQQAQSVIPDQSITLTSDQNGVLTNQGSRPVYVEERTEGVPVSPPEIENVFRLERTLYRDSSTSVKPGEALRMGERLAMVIKVSKLPRSMNHLVIDQRLPAGLEPLPASAQNLAFKLREGTSIRKPTRPRHLEVRDDRILIFPHRLSPGSHLFVVWVRAVTPGDYRFPALFAQGMYQEDVQARTSETRLEVEP